MGKRWVVLFLLPLLMTCRKTRYTKSLWSVCVASWLGRRCGEGEVTLPLRVEEWMALGVREACPLLLPLWWIPLGLGHSFGISSSLHSRIHGYTWPLQSFARRSRMKTNRVASKLSRTRRLFSTKAGPHSELKKGQMGGLERQPPKFF
jgi:hypothetical protein